MDDSTLQENRKRLTGLDRKLSDLAIKQRTVEAKLAGEHENVRKCVAQRAGLVAQLIDADEEKSKRLHRGIDSADAQILASERQAEALQHALKAIANETASTTNQRDQLNTVVGQAINAREFQQWAVELQQARADAEKAFADARLKLSALDSLCARGIERFPGAGNVAAATFEDLLIRQANLEANGWRLSTPVFRADAIVHVRALVPR